ncbi:MAG: hypothetical protein IPL23_11340 [Saprospiraceae bacterium]|nr:hypothetical protein [Saprospiraceae bacterium]MBP7642632.1 hypothetical protein [Saprospiraceae bacterium]HMS68906.1 hypothetical protein [Saprospiraceae bacterium]
MEKYLEFRKTNSKPLLEKKLIEDRYSAEEAKATANSIDETFRADKVKTGKERVTAGLALVGMGIFIFITLMFSSKPQKKVFYRVAVAMIIGGGVLAGKGSNDITVYKVSMEEDANLPYYKRNR